MSILSPEDLFAEKVLFWVMLLEKTKKKVLNLLPVALPKRGIGLVF
jgi:hypothetical protein